MPKKFKRLNQIALTFFVAVSVLVLVILFASLFLGEYVIAAKMVGSLIVTVIVSLILLATRNTWQADKADPKIFHCPHCGEERPLARLPKSLNQMVTGGWTCPNCGREVIPPNKNQNIIWILVSLALIIVGVSGLFLARIL